MIGFSSSKSPVNMEKSLIRLVESPIGCEKSPLKFHESPKTRINKNADSFKINKLSA